MVAPVEHSTDYPVSVTDLYSALTDEGYWKDRVSEFGNDSHVVGFSDVDGRITSVVNQAVDAEMLPKALRRFAGAHMIALCTEWWGPLEGGLASGGYELVVARTPIVVAGRIDMADTGSRSSRLRFVGTVEATVPIMGPVVEKIMIGEIDRSFATERDFTVEWLTARG